MITEGKKAPPFILRNQDGKIVSLAGHVGKKIVLYFYPKDDTPGCTVEGKEFSDLLEKFRGYNTVVLGVSRDTVESHKGFCDLQGFGMDLLSDESGGMSESYGAWREKSQYGKMSMGIVRSTVVIDENGIVRKHWKNVRPRGHAEKVLGFVSSL